MRRNLVILFVAVLGVGLLFYLTHQYAIFWFLGGMGLILGIGIYDMVQVKNSVLRNYPVAGHIRYILREISPEIHQYFVESNTDGVPFSKNEIGLVNARADLALQNHPFGTERDVYKDGHEWVAHCAFPVHIVEEPRVIVGGPLCTLPYDASLLNISAMSYGSLGKNAILALNAGAKDGRFYHNTGEGGLSEYHLREGGDVVWQIGTGYFGCRTVNGMFDETKFAENAQHEQVRMIELKLSQGAKPGHGGVLPGKKVTPEIARIRGVTPHQTVISPPYHTAFKGYHSMMEFIQQLRELSGGKPVGFKFCVGTSAEVDALCQAMIDTEITPDFITVDSSNGGTGAAPLEFSNHVGRPGEEGLVKVVDALRGYDLHEDVKVIYSGKVITGFRIVRAMALGASLCNNARGFMFSLGCIQSLRCHANTCPTGVATQNPRLEKGLVVRHKRPRVKNFHHETVRSAMELMGAMGVTTSEGLRRELIYQWASEYNRSLTLEEIYPSEPIGARL